ncbi:tetraacyldisaccharide 4'-kinase [Salinimonas sediminis]|uniref:Tetraacyldisaccharide 4'-kinase n=1 Tax=Salinimonas sediminis TaxID=2303538 RepID=A0A346NLQ8_9ALTE|nr:tetraacyldisaccharide 4'-kinase [Salinimonas sediminis]AXR06465.1 tetraacyldisaccharide 4'-kinase [Salinimonas sediminis]
MSVLERAWYRAGPWLWLLWPLSWLFAIISASRRYLFKAGFKASSKPAGTLVIVVGNISVGGNGKTPVVIDVAEYLLKQGLRPGILSRGYGGSNTVFPHLVTAGDTAAQVGDEPKLMALRTGVPVVTDPKRARGANWLREQHQCNVIVCDDGLQHYALKRDMELVVMDERRFGNGHLLPMGPLREGVWRLDTVDMIIHNVRQFGSARLLGVAPAQYPMQLAPNHFVNVADPSLTQSLATFMETDRNITALAGIGNPARFFSQLDNLGISCKQQIPFADHYEFSPQDIPSGTVVMTEKDAVKVASFAHDDCWYIKVSAQLPQAFYHQLDQKLAPFKKIQKEHDHGI